MEFIRKTLFCVVVFTVLVLLLPSCSTSVVKITSTDISSLTDLSTETIPLRAGYYVGTISKVFLGDQQLNFLLDVELKDLFRKEANKIFAEIVPLSGTKVLEDFHTKDLDVILAVKQLILSDNLGDGRVLSPTFRYTGDRMCKATVTAMWEVTSSGGTQIYFTNIIGEGQAKVPFGTLRGSFWKYRKQAYIAAINDHFQKTYADISGSGWWKDSEWKNK